MRKLMFYVKCEVSIKDAYFVERHSAYDYARTTSEMWTPCDVYLVTFADARVETEEYVRGYYRGALFTAR